MSGLESSSLKAMSDTAIETGPSDVLSDFKKAAHALMDAIELGFFKRVSVYDDGSLCDCKSGPLFHVDSIIAQRFKNDEKRIHLSVSFQTNAGDAGLTDLSIEELRGRKGMFLDENDAKRIQIQKRIKSLEGDLANLNKRAAELQKSIDERKAEIAKL